MALSFINDDILHNIGEAIRTKLGVSDKFFPDEMATKILEITMGFDTSDATVTEKTLPYNVIAYGKNGKVVGDVPNIYNRVFYTTNKVKYGSNLRLNVTSGNSVFFSPNPNTGLITISTTTPLAGLGNVPADKVAYGYTFTSSAGVEESGTMENADTIKF